MYHSSAMILNYNIGQWYSGQNTRIMLGVLPIPYQSVYNSSVMVDTIHLASKLNLNEMTLILLIISELLFYSVK